MQGLSALGKLWQRVTGGAPPRREVEAVLTDEVVSSYRPGHLGVPGGLNDAAATPHLARYFQDVEAMVSHPAISHPLNAFKSGVANAEFELLGASTPRVGAFALDEAKRFWSRGLRAAQVSYQYGRGACEIVYDREDGLLRLEAMQACMPLDARVLLQGSDYAGVRIKGQAGTYDLWGPRPGLPAKGYWRCHDRRYSKWYGIPQCYPAWRPWRRLAGRDGGEENTDMGVYRFALAIPVGRYPANDVHPIASADGGVAFTNNRDKMLELLEGMKAGQQLALPSTRDEQNEYRWGVEPLTMGLDIPGLIAYTDSLSKACSLGCGWPPELTEASETGSGYSGRAIPLEVYYVGQQHLAEDLLDGWYRQIGGPLLEWNFGAGSWARIKVKNLLESRQAASQKSQQPPAQPGQPGDPPGKGKPPGKGEDAAEEGEEFGTDFATSLPGDEWVLLETRTGKACWRNSRTGDRRYQVKKPVINDAAGKKAKAVEATPAVVETPGDPKGKYRVGGEHFKSRKAAQAHVNGLKAKGGAGGDKSAELARGAMAEEVREYAALGMSPGEVNSGECGEVAERVVEAVRAAGGEADYGKPNVGPAHVWVVAGGKHYDAQHPEGVGDPSQLTFFDDNPDLLEGGWGASKDRTKKKAKKPEPLTAETLVPLVEELQADSKTELVPVWQLRQLVAERHGPEAASHEQFDALMRKLRREGVLRLVAIGDRSRATKEQLADSIPGENETMFDVKVVRP